MRYLRLSIFFFISIYSTGAYSLSTDFDGVWSVTVSCGKSRWSDPFSIPLLLKVVDGKSVSEVSIRADSRTDLTVEFSGNRVSLKAITGRPNPAPAISDWHINMLGIITGDSRFDLTGDEWVHGTYARKCNAEGLLSNPSPMSLAGIRQINKQNSSVDVKSEPASTKRQDFSWWLPGDVVNTSEKKINDIKSNSAVKTENQVGSIDQLLAIGLQNNEQVRAIQIALKFDGFYSGVVDGIPGPQTQLAVSAWQRSEGVLPNGRLTLDQFAKLSLKASIASVIIPPTRLVVEPRAKDPDAGERENLQQTNLEQRLTSRIGPKAAKQIFVGNNKDILLFTNENPLAPNFMRKVTDAYVFRGNRMNVCSIGSFTSMNPAFASLALVALQKINPTLIVQPIPPWDKKCKSLTDNDRDDVFAVLRSEVVNDPRLQEQVVMALAARKIRFYETIEQGPFDLLIKQQEENRKILNTKLKNGTLSGYGLLVSASDNRVVCSTGKQDGEAIKRIVNDINLGIVSDKAPGKDPVIIMSDIDDIFLRTKRGECGFVLSDGPTLMMLDKALSRDGFALQLIPVFLPQEKVDALVSQIQTEREILSLRADNLQAEKARLAELVARDLKMRAEVALQAEEQKKTEMTQQARLDETRRLNDETARIEELERTRRLVSSRGRAIQDALDKRIRKHMTSIIKELEDTKMRAKLGKVLTPQEIGLIASQNELDRLGLEFPDWSNDIMKKAKEEWSFGDIKATLEDYGQAKWRGRDIEAISVRVELPMSNPIIGERTTDCEVFTWINDEEFKFWRQAFSTDCASFDNSFKKWSTANQFVSQWKLKTIGTVKR